MRTFLSILLMIIASIGCSNNSMNINVSKTQGQFQVVLRANPTTGHRWTVKQYDSNILQVVSSTYVASRTKLMGAGGNMIFTFQIKKNATLPKSTKILFFYAQPWEPQRGTLQKVMINFK